MSTQQDTPHAGHPAPPPAAPPSPRRLTRSTTDKRLGGVCGGLAEHLGLDPTVVRVLAVLAVVLTFPLGLVAYLVLWAVVPRDRR